MNGSIDENGRALLSIRIRPPASSESTSVVVWVDTGMTGDLVLPLPTIDALSLPHSGSVDAILADGSQIALQTYTCFIEWFAAQRRVEAIANNGAYPLLGIGMLLGLELHINYHSMELALNRPVQ